MTLAETASIFCETIVFNRALESSSDDDRLAVLELFLQSATQVIVDILSRFKFESAVFERREHAELSPDDLSELMLQAQRDTYGDGLDGELLHRYMWAVKPHYYRSGLSFYNFPYAFGQLFGLALYSKYTEDEHEFPARYKKLLQLTGQATANDVTREAGFDIEDPAFWQSGIDVIAQRVNDFAALAASGSSEPGRGAPRSGRSSPSTAMRSSSGRTRPMSRRRSTRNTSTRATCRRSRSRRA
jgi:oligoendopeptidase F